MAKTEYTIAVDAKLGEGWSTVADAIQGFALEARIAALEARVAALETPGTITVETQCPECQARTVGRILARQARGMHL